MGKGNVIHGDNVVHLLTKPTLKWENTEKFFSKLAESLKLIQFDGTIESFNQIKAKCFPSDFKIYFINEHNELTLDFQKKFIVMPLKIIYKEGDYIPTD